MTARRLLLSFRHDGYILEVAIVTEIDSVMGRGIRL